MAGLSSAGAAQPRASPAICAIDRRRATTSTSLSIQSPIPRARKRVRFVTFSWHFLLIAVDDTSFTSACSLDNWPSRSNERIFYGKQEEPLAPKEHMMPYKAKKQCVA